MEWWVRMMSPMQRVWIRVAARIRIRKSGLGQLQREVRTCEYEDVHVMWEMLRKHDAEVGNVSSSRRRRRGARQRMWSVLESLCFAF